MYTTALFWKYTEPPALTIEVSDQQGAALTGLHKHMSNISCTNENPYWV